MKSTFETDVLLFSGQVRKGDELPLVPRHRVSVGINTYPLERLTLSLFGNYVGKQFMLGDEPNRASIQLYEVVTRPADLADPSHPMRSAPPDTG